MGYVQFHPFTSRITSVHTDPDRITPAGQWRRQTGCTTRRSKASRRALFAITKPALLSLCLAILFEVPLVISLSRFGAWHFAYYLSDSAEVADITERMWRTIDWCYVFYSLEHGAGDRPAHYSSQVVPLPESGEQLAVRSALGHRLPGQGPRPGQRVDVSFVGIWR